MLRITEILTNDNKPTVGPRPKREKPVVAAPVEGATTRRRQTAKKKAPAKKAAPRQRPRPRAKPDAKKPGEKRQKVTLDKM